MKGRIKQERVAAGFTQDSLGAELGVSGGTIGRWEKDASCVKQEHLLKMSHIFDCSISWIVGESDTRRKPEVS